MTGRCAQATKLSGTMVERLGSQSNCLALYKRFLESPNFGSWFERRRQAAMLWQVRAAMALSRRGCMRHGEA